MNVILLGERLKAMRNYLGLSQKELACKLSETSDMLISQNAISRIETAKGGNIEFFLNLLNFYSKHFNVDLVFSPSFEIIANESNTLKKSLNSVIIAKLDLLKEDIDNIKLFLG